MINSTKGGTRAARTTRASLVLGTTVCVAAVLAGCTPTDDTGDTAGTTAPETATPAPSAEVAAPAPSDAPAPTTIPFEAGHVPDNWSPVDGVACGMSATDLVTQDDRFRIELTGPMVTGTDGTVYQPVLVEHELGDDAALYFGDNVQLVWSQGGGVVVDLGWGWHEGGGPILQAADAQGLPTDDYSAWEEDAADPALRRTRGLAGVANYTTCWPTGVDEESGFTMYDEPRPDGEYDVRAAIVAMVDGESRLVVSDPVTVEWVAPAVD